MTTRYITYDTEFLEDGKTIDLISIALVGDDGREYYAVNYDCNFERVCSDDWLWKNVCRYLPTTKSDADWELQPPNFGQLNCRLDRESALVKPKWVIANEVRDFIKSYSDSFLTDEDYLPQLWAYYGAYDHVALAQLWGKMIDLPKCVPMFTHDLKQLVGQIENFTYPEREGNEHDALEDARWNMQALRGALNELSQQTRKEQEPESRLLHDSLSKGPW